MRFKRLAIEAQREKVRRRGHGILLDDPLAGMAGWVAAVLKLTGLYSRGERNANSPALARFDLTFDNLPAAFDGFRILHISDLHFNRRPGFTEAVYKLLKGVETDLCAMTGDFRFGWYGPNDEVYGGIECVLSGITSGHGFVAVLGNHDLASFIPAFQRMGVRVLVNEALELRQGNDAIWLAGVDDPHRFRCDDLSMAMSGVSFDAFTILLAHSPEIIEEAAAAGVNLYLCGHTHAGQIRFPIIGAPIVNARAPRRFCAGQWTHQNMRGYTSSGLGTTDVPVRFNCPPQTALIRLRRP